MDELKEIREALEVLLSWMPRGIGERGEASKAWDKGQHALAALSRLEAREAAPKTVPMAMLRELKEIRGSWAYGYSTYHRAEIEAVIAEAEADGYTAEG
jgi:hypothetical protein